MFNKKKQPPIKSLIAQGTRIEGHVLFHDGLRIDGEVIGDIRANDEKPSILVVSEVATVTGQIHADHVRHPPRVGVGHRTDNTTDCCQCADHLDSISTRSTAFL